MVRRMAGAEGISGAPANTLNFGASTVLEADLPRSVRERWTITTNFLGIPRATHAQSGYQEGPVP